MPRVTTSTSEVAIYTYGKCVKSGRSAPNCDYVIDVAGFRDPMSSGGFRANYKDGRPGQVQSYVAEDPRYEAILDMVKILSYVQLRSPAKGDSTSWISIAIRDHHGIWTAPAVGELIADAMDREGYKTSLYHVDLMEATSK